MGLPLEPLASEGPLKEFLITSPTRNPPRGLPRDSCYGTPTSPTWSPVLESHENKQGTPVWSPLLYSCIWFITWLVLLMGFGIYV